MVRILERRSRAKIPMARPAFTVPKFVLKSGVIFSVTVISRALLVQILQSDTYLHFSGRQYSSVTPHLSPFFFFILLFGVFGILEVQIKREI